MIPEDGLSNPLHGKESETRQDSACTPACTEREDRAHHGDLDALAEKLRSLPSAERRRLAEILTGEDDEQS